MKTKLRITTLSHKSLFIALLSVILMVPLTSSAQFILGPQAGVNMSTLTGDLQNTNMKLGANAGLIFGYEFSNRFSIRLDPIYAINGTKEKYAIADPITGGASTVTSTLDLMYGHASLLADYSVPIDRKGVVPYDPVGRSVFIDFYLGPYAGYFLGGKSNTTTKGQNSETTSSATYTSADTMTISHIDIGATAGIGFKAIVGKERRGRLFASFTFNYGILSIDNGLWATLDPVSGKYVYKNVTNQVIMFNFGYALSLQPKSRRVR